MEKEYQYKEMEMFMKDNGEIIIDMEQVHIHGMMAIDILGIGSMDKDKEKASFGGQMEINILDNGKMIKETVKVKKYGLMEIDMKAIG
jgi:hypothetical protein